MAKSELTIDELNQVTGGLIKQGTVKPLFPTTTGPMLPIAPPVVVYRR